MTWLAIVGILWLILTGILYIRYLLDTRWHVNLQPGDYIRAKIWSKNEGTLLVTAVVIENYSTIHRLNVKYNIEFQNRDLFDYKRRGFTLDRIIVYKDAKKHHMKDYRNHCIMFVRFSQKIRDQYANLQRNTEKSENH